MFKKILVANRGEIALRIIRACGELGIETVAIHSEADRDSLHVRFADESVCVGKAESSESYLNKSRIISSALITSAEAIHPGYGFLAEDVTFARACQDSGICFIGPLPDTLESMGNKIEARKKMQEAEVPVIPGSTGPLIDAEEAVNLAGTIGYPVLLKAAAGGGGKGIRFVDNDLSLENNFILAQAEAEVAFGNSELYLEKYIDKPKHVEIQVLGDSFGSVVQLGERDCSIQRKHQKLVEESPCPTLNEDVRRVMGETAILACRTVEYQSAGTVEFLLDENQDFYFIEMNTRIQVEHPVTEMRTGVDLLKEQILIDAGKPLKITQSEIAPRGHAIECRINAEDPFNGFLPCPGRVTGFHIPGGPGLRVDTHLHEDCYISPYYDSLLAKIISFGNDRNEAVSRMKRALSELVIEGVTHTAPFHLELLKDRDFLSGNFNTAFLENKRFFK